jgi:hypothetical protein
VVIPRVRTAPLSVAMSAVSRSMTPMTLPVGAVLRLTACAGRSIGQRAHGGKASKQPRREADVRRECPSAIAPAKRDERIVEEGGTIGLVGSGSCADEGVEQAAHGGGIEVARDQDDAGAPIAVGPARQLDRGMEDVLHAVNDHGAIRRLCELHDALETKETGSVHRAQEIEEHVEHGGRNRGLARKRERANALVVTIDIVVMVIVLSVVTGGRKGLGREPARDVGDLAVGIEQPAAEQALGRGLAGRGVEDGRAGLSARSRATRARPFSGAARRSVLLSTMRSATATCFTDSMCASSVAAPLIASTTVITPSSR